jgi:hypothetical protein
MEQAPRFWEYKGDDDLKREKMKWRELRWVIKRLRVGWEEDSRLVLKTAVVCTRR